MHKGQGVKWWDLKCILRSKYKKMGSDLYVLKSKYKRMRLLKYSLISKYKRMGFIKYALISKYKIMGFWLAYELRPILSQ